ncbi:MAG: hypothetical protein HY327_11315 [Chloroflexi bacterium]|nr:hypothetical protein [Chloroflexota bacterium]
MPKEISRNVTGLILLIGILNLVEGILLYAFPDALGPLIWPTRLGTYGARFYGAVFIAIALTAGLIARARAWERVRILFPPAMLFTALALIAAIFLFDTPNTFEATRLTTWIFFAVYGGALIGAVAVYWKYESKN